MRNNRFIAIFFLFGFSIDAAKVRKKNETAIFWQSHFLWPLYGFSEERLYYLTAGKRNLLKYHKIGRCLDMSVDFFVIRYYSDSKQGYYTLKQQVVLNNYIQIINFEY